MHKRVCPECDEEFMPRYGGQVCCSDKCKLNRKRQQMRESYRHGQSMTFAEEREEKARRRAAFFAARDAAFERAGLPIPKIEVRDGVRYESRGQCSIAPHFSPLVAVHRKGYYYR